MSPDKPRKNSWRAIIAAFREVSGLAARDFLEKRNVDPAKICMQIPEQEAAKFIKQTQKTVLGLREIGVAFALEHYGLDQNRFQILDLLRPNFIKIDGELMHSLIKLGIGKANGGNCVHLDESSEEDTRQRRHDAIWVIHID